MKAFCVISKIKCNSNNKVNLKTIVKLPSNNHVELFLQYFAAKPKTCLTEDLSCLQADNKDYLTNVKAFCVISKIKCNSNNKVSLKTIVKLPGNNNVEWFLQYFAAKPKRCLKEDLSCLQEDNIDYLTNLEQSAYLV